MIRRSAAERWGWLELPAVLTGLLLLCVASYASGVRGDFVWDDRYLIVENQYVKDPGYALKLLTTDFWDMGESQDRFRSFYRPLITLSYMADWALWGPHPTGFHLTNLFGHLVASFLGYLLLAAVSGDRRVAAVGAAVFAVHPTHVESVGWISGRTDVLCAVLYLSAVLVYLRTRAAEPPRRRRLGNAGTALLFFTALLAKEMALSLPFVLVLLEVVRPLPGEAEASARERVGRAARRLAPHFAVVAGYLVLRVVLLGAVTTTWLRLDLVPRALSIAHVLRRYLELLLFPVNLDLHWMDGALATGFADPRALPAVLTVVACLVAAACCWRSSRPALLGLGWIGLTLVPVFHLGSFGDVLLAERFLYLPSLGFSLLVGLAVVRAVRDRPRGLGLAAVLTALVVVPLAVRTARRNLVWTTEVRLFETALRTSAESPYIHTNLGIAYFEAGRLEDAIRMVEKAVAMQPRSTVAWNVLGVAYERQGRPADAIAAYRRAVQLAPREPRGYYNWGNALQALGRHEEAIERYRLALDRKRDYGEAWTNLSASLAAVGRLTDAVEAGRKAIASDASLVKGWVNYGQALGRSGDLAGALTAFDTALRLAPESAVAHHNRGEALSLGGRREAAAESFRRAIALDPRYAAPRLSLARDLLAGGDARGALAVLEGAPDTPAVRALAERARAGLAG